MALLVAQRALRDRRRGFIGWALGIAAYVALISAFYPSVRSSELQRALRDYPKELKAFFGGAASFDFSTGAGYLNAELFSLVVPLLLVIAAVAFGARTLAGEQEEGTLDLLLANPVTRRRVVLEKMVGLAATVGALAVVVALAVLGTALVVDLDVSAGNVAAAGLGAALLAVLMGLVAMLVGAATGSRSVAIGVATVAFAASYLVVGLAGIVSWIEPLRVLSPLYHANGTVPLRNGLPVVNSLVLVGLCLAVAAGTVRVFERRDLVR